jgi:aspartate racemase
MKVIGVLGGMGPQVTIDFEARIHSVSQQLTPAGANPIYPPMVVYYYRDSPFLMREEHTPVLPLQADPRILDAAKKLGACADFLVITSNGVHQVKDAIEQASGLAVLSMIDVTLEEMNRRGWKKVGVVTFGPPTVYAVPLEKRGITYECIPHELNNRLRRSIIRYQAGQEDATDRAIAQEAIAALRSQNVDGVIMGCTEIPLLLQSEANAPDLLNPAQYLAEAAVRYALV